MKTGQYRDITYEKRAGATLAPGLSEVLSSMPKTLKSAIAATVLAAGMWFASVTPSYAKPEYAKTEGKTCSFCHVTAGKPELNAAGDYYAAHDHSLKGYTPAK